MSENNFWNFKNKKEKIKELYTDPKNLVTIEFSNNSGILKYIWVEPTCVSIELDENMEYQVITHDKTFRLEFEKEQTITFYLQYSFGFILNKRQKSSDISNPNKWILEIDMSDIN